MPGVTKVNGFTTPDQFFGRDILGINVAGMAACPALDGDGNLVKWDDLEAAVAAVEQRFTVSVVGDFTAGDVEVNMIIEGVDLDADAYGAGVDIYAELSAVTGLTVTAFAI
jgi:hypothetical protein